MLFSWLAEKYLERRRKRGYIEGRAEGHAEERQMWMEWNERRLAAEAVGEIFDEPAPPPINSNGSD